MKRISWLTLAAFLSGSGAALADVSVCISISATGPASALGVPQQNSVQFLPTWAGSESMRYTVFDDATDASLATQNARKCVNEQDADILIGGSSTPTTMAIAAVSAEAEVPFLSLAPFVPQGEQNARAALAIADRAYVMEHGRVALSGTGAEIAANPRVEEIYIGSLNV